MVQPFRKAESFEFYELTRRRIEPAAFEIATAAVWSCAICPTVISGMGGPGNGELCIACGDLIKRGKLKLVAEANKCRNPKGGCVVFQGLGCAHRGDGACQYERFAEILGRTT